MNAEDRQTYAECLRLMSHELGVICGALARGQVPTEGSITSLARYRRVAAELEGKS